MVLAQETNCDSYATGDETIAFVRRLVFNGEFEAVIRYLQPLLNELDDEKK